MCLTRPAAVNVKLKASTYYVFERKYFVECMSLHQIYKYILNDFVLLGLSGKTLYMTLPICSLFLSSVT